MKTAVPVHSNIGEMAILVNKRKVINPAIGLLYILLQNPLNVLHGVFVMFKAIVGKYQ